MVMRTGCCKEAGEDRVLRGVKVDVDIVMTRVAVDVNRVMTRVEILRDRVITRVEGDVVGSRREWRLT